MPKVYRTAIGWRILFAVTAPPLIAGFGYLMVLPLIEHRTFPIGAIAFLMAFGGGLSAMFLYGLLTMFRWRIEVFPDRIREVGLFKATELAFEQIEGVRLVPTQYINCLDFVPGQHTSAKKIRVSMMMADAAEFAAWAFATFRNLTLEERQAEIGAVLQNEDLGETEAQRVTMLERAHKWVRVVNGLGWAAMLWAMLYPRPYKLAGLVLIAVPVVAVVSVHFFAGAIKFDAKRHSPHPTIITAMLLPIAALVLRAFLDFQILAWYAFWVPFIAISAVFFALALVNLADVRGKVSLVLAALVIAAVYGYGATITLNGILDSSTPKVYDAQLLSKHESGGQSTQYYFMVSKWGPPGAPGEVRVSRSEYGRRNAGDRIHIAVWNGAFNIPWFSAN